MEYRWGYAWLQMAHIVKYSSYSFYLCVRKLLRVGDSIVNATIIIPVFFFPDVTAVTNWRILLGREKHNKLLTDVFSSLLLIHLS